MTTEPITFARAANCPAGLPVKRAAACGFMRDPAVAAFLARLRGEGWEVVIAPDGWQPLGWMTHVDQFLHDTGGS